MGSSALDTNVWSLVWLSMGAGTLGAAAIML